MNIYNFKSYKEYLKDFLKSQPGKGHGLRSKWAEAIGCQVAYVTHTLMDRANLSLEQAKSLSEHLEHTDEESDFFLLLVEKERAGTESLKKYFSKKIEVILSQREVIKNRMKMENELSIEKQAVYYSKWYYTAVHMALTIPELKNPKSIAEHFNISLKLVMETLQFLESAGLVELKNNQYSVTQNQIHLSKESPLFFSQQNFLRHKAMSDLFSGSADSVHFGACFTLSEKDVLEIKRIFLDSIEKATEVIKPSAEEKLYAVTLDFFEFK